MGNINLENRGGVSILKAEREAEEKRETRGTAT